MANAAHFKRLKLGVGPWNKWRKENTEIIPDLSRADLRGAKLNKADFRRADLRGAMLNGADLNEANLRGAHLSGVKLEKAYLIKAVLSLADLSEAHLIEARLMGANLSGAKFMGANLNRADLSMANLNRADFSMTDLSGADLSLADLTEAHLSEAVLSEAHLREAHLGKADLSKAKLHKADLSRADLGEANLTEADLNGADLNGTNLSMANLFQADLTGADLRRANFQDADVSKVKYDRRAQYAGIRVETCYGSPRFKRYAQDQDYIEELRSRRWGFPLYVLWLILADCGRSLPLWTGWCFVFVFSFALFYTPCPEGLPAWLKPVIPNFLCEQIQSCGAAFEQTAESYAGRPMTLGSAFYFSIVTFTTLGFGDVITANGAARVLVTLEVILGYVMLGGLISIFATKLARRS